MNDRNYDSGDLAASAVIGIIIGSVWAGLVAGHRNYYGTGGGFIGTDRDMTVLAAVSGMVVGAIVGGLIGLITYSVGVGKFYDVIIGAIIVMAMIALLAIRSNGLNQRDLLHMLTCVPIGSLISLLSFKQRTIGNKAQ